MRLTGDHGNWEILGPGGGGAQFLQSISPHDVNFLVVACDMTGLYVSTDGGISWRECNLLSRVDAVSFDPHHADVIYAGTASMGLYRSLDRGSSWDLLYPPPKEVVTWKPHGDHADNQYVLDNAERVQGGFQKIRVHPRHPSRLVAALKRALPTSSIILLSSDDGGETWNPFSTLPAQQVYEIFMRRSGDEVYIFADTNVYVVGYRSQEVKALLSAPLDGGFMTDASWGWDPVAESPIFYALTSSRWSDHKLSSGIWRSRDHGASWTELDAPIDPRLSPASGQEPPHFSHIRACEEDGRWLYISADSCPALTDGFPEDCLHGRYGIVRSTDAGDEFQWVFKGIEYTIPSNYDAGWVERDYLFGTDGTVFTGLGVCASQPTVLLFGDYMATAKTLDGGTTWTQLYCRLTDGGAASTNGMDVTTSYGVHFDPFDPHHVVISYTDIGMFHSFDEGKSWHHAIRGVPLAWRNTGYWMVFDPEIRGKAWAAWGQAHDLPRPKMLVAKFQNAQGGVTRSTDGLETWSTSHQGMPENCVVTHLLLDPKSPRGKRTLYAAGFGHGAFKSVDDGTTWTPINRGLGANRNAWRLVMAPNDDLLLVVARGYHREKPIDGALYRSRDQGATWDAISLPEHVNAPNDLVCDPLDPKRMYLAAWPSTINDREEYGGVWLTEDGGHAWTKVFDAASHVFGITMDAKDSAALFLNTFNSGAYRSKDGGNTWTKLEGYDFKWGHGVFIDPHHEHRIYLTTFGSSVWRSDFP